MTYRWHDFDTIPDSPDSIMLLALPDPFGRGEIHICVVRFAPGY
jgi:hypothetical protein